MTVEASFVVPLTFIIILLLLYFGFYCFDRCVTLQNCYIVALRTSNQWEAGVSQKKEYAEKEWEKLTNKVLIFLEDRDFKIEINGDVQLASFQADLKNRFYEKYKIGPGKMQLSETMKARKIYPADTIRTYRLWR